MKDSNLIGISGKKYSGKDLFFDFFNEAKNNIYERKKFADNLKIKPPSATSIIKKLEKRKLVKRIHDKNDKRIVYIKLTKKTEKHLELIWKQKQEMFDKLISKLSKIDRENLHRIIKIIITD